MASVNKVIVLGNLGRDPEHRTFPDGGAICTVSVATTRRWKQRDSGDTQEETEWHRLVFQGKLADVAHTYLQKGDPVYVDGRLKTRKWTDKEGKDNYITEIVVENMQLLKPRERDDGARANSRTPAPPPRSAASAPKSQPAPRPPTSFDDMDDDIPF